MLWDFQASPSKGLPALASILLEHIYHQVRKLSLVFWWKRHHKMKREMYPTDNQNQMPDVLVDPP